MDLKRPFCIFYLLKTLKSKNMKVLFLDIDGVVNSAEDQTKGLFKTDFPVEPYKAFLVGKIQLDTDCLVVLSSTWRSDTESVEKLNKQLVPIHDITGRCCAGIRGVEIHQWINKNIPWEERKKGGSFRYAILDDDSDMLLWQKDHFFQTTWQKGITEEIANNIIKHLNS